MHQNYALYYACLEKKEVFEIQRDYSGYGAWIRRQLLPLSSVGYSVVATALS